MSRKRKYCSAQPYLDYIGVSERERKEWRREKMKEINEKLLMEKANDVSWACHKNGLYGGADILAKWLRELGLKVPLFSREKVYRKQNAT
jgi:hypothetical protein